MSYLKKWPNRTGQNIIGQIVRGQNVRWPNCPTFMCLGAWWLVCQDPESCYFWFILLPLDLSCGECNGIFLNFLYWSANGSICLVCCESDSVCELFGKTIRIFVGVFLILLLNVMKGLSVGEVLCWIVHVWSSNESVCCDCDPSVHLYAPSIGFICVCACRKLSLNLRICELYRRCLLSSCTLFLWCCILCGRVRDCSCYASYLWYVVLVCHLNDVCKDCIGSVDVGLWWVWWSDRMHNLP